MTHRMERVSHLIRQEISLLLEREVKDPRLGGFVTITDVVITTDMRHAKVFVSQVGDGGNREEILAALTAASGFIRNELAQRLKLRRIPELSFHWDDSIERGARLLELIDRVSTHDEQHQD